MKILLFGTLFGILLIIPFANAQEFELETLQESAVILYDQKLSNSIIASIGIETTNNNEIRFSDELIEKINANDMIKAIVFTNKGECVIGVTSNEQCIMINFDYQQLKGDGGIRMVQDSARDMGNELIEELNEIFSIETEFHSTFIHTVDDANQILETTGAISGRGTVSATYTTSKQSTDYIFLDLSGKLIPKNIRESGGFYDIAKKLSKNDESIISVSIIPHNDENLFIFKVATEVKNDELDISKINPMDPFDVEKISRSSMFDGKNVPLNSVIQLIIIPKEQSQINAIATHAITDVTKLENISEKGWFFVAPAGNKIDARFLFGQDNAASKDELRVETSLWDGEKEMTFYSVENIPQQEKIEYESIEEFGKNNSDGDDQSQYAVLGIIIAAGIGAAVFYLKGYKPKH